MTVYHSRRFSQPEMEPLRYLSNVYNFLPDEFNQRQVHETSLYRTPGPWTGSSDEAEWTNDNKGKLINNNSIDATEANDGVVSLEELVFRYS